MGDSTKQDRTKPEPEVEDEEADSSEEEEEFPGEEESEPDSDAELDEEDKIQVDLEARAPLEKDFHGIKQLLARLFLTLHVDASELANVIISQQDVGSIVKVADEGADEEEEPSTENEEDEEVYGISSVVNMKQHTDKTCIQQLKTAVLSKCKANAPDSLTQFQSILDTKTVGFLVNERFINIPPQFAVPLHKSLHIEVKEHNAVQQKSLDYLLLISKTLQLTDHPEAEESEPKKAKRTKKCEVEYTNVEEELFQVASECSFRYSVAEATGLAIGGSWDVGSQLAKPSRTVMLVPAGRWEGVVEAVEELIDGT